MHKSRICSTGSMLQMAGALQVTVESNLRTVLGLLPGCTPCAAGHPRAS